MTKNDSETTPAKEAAFVRLGVTLPPELLERLDNLVRRHSLFPTRSATLRYLLTRALGTVEAEIAKGDFKL